MGCKWINKVGLAAFQNNKLLVVRKQGTTDYILPGGKPENNESDLQALSREISEELGCKVLNPHFYGVFVDVATHSSNAVVVVRLYGARLDHKPKPRAEIEQIEWISLTKPNLQTLAPSIQNKILPFLRRRYSDSKSIETSNDYSEKTDLFGLA
ncbi:NUDIX hydrolase [Tateyamaria sp.]|uniref:NUDIX hydrolase n=1 Tax=Tateyamaria sp. TaxID=1929288 RepID=UPI00329FCAF9